MLQNNFYSDLLDFLMARVFFHIALKGNHCVFSFTIELHYNDIEILKKIAHNLGVGKVYMVGNRSAKYSVSAFQDIVSIILPIFNLYPLQTTKALYFADFSEAVKIVLNSKANGKRLRLTEAEILKIKNL